MLFLILFYMLERNEQLKCSISLFADVTPVITHNAKNNVDWQAVF